MNEKHYKLVLGLEIHLHLKTSTKMFCGCSTDIYGVEPNTRTCPVCLGLPGALPVPNFEAIQKTQVLGLALGCQLNPKSRFDRKHYFYPDLPKGFQITQYEKPLCQNGTFELELGEIVEIERVHLEEDTAKSFHEGGKTLVDFNKSGMPLVEIVTKPSFKSAEDAVEFSKKLRDLVRFLDLGEGDMEKGQLRIEPNISLRTSEMERNGKLPDYKVEVKNINSFRFMERAVKVEIKRQEGLLNEGRKIIQENRGYDPNKNETLPQRSKEEAHDYRYFPEPDIPPMVFDDDYIEKLKKSMGELPWEIRRRLVTQYGLSEGNAKLLTEGPGLELLSKFEEYASENINPNKVANLLLNRVDFRNLTKEGFLKKIEQEKSSIDNTTFLKEMAAKVISENPKPVEDFKKGKETAFEFLVGLLMRETKGKADAVKAREVLKETLH